VNWQCRFVGFTNETIVRKAVSWFNGKKVHGQCITVEESYMTRHLKTGCECVENFNTNDQTYSVHKFYDLFVTL